MDNKDNKDKDKTDLDFASGGNYHWAGSTYKNLGGSTNNYNPRVPVHLDGANKAKAEDDITWADQWASLRTRLKTKHQEYSGNRRVIRTAARRGSAY